VIVDFSLLYLFSLQNLIHQFVNEIIFVLGLVTGALSNITSGGAGVFTTFVFTNYAGLSFQESVGTVLLASTVVVMIGAIVFYRKNQVDERLSLTLGIPGFFVSLSTAYLATQIQSSLLSRSFGAFTLVIAVLSLYRFTRANRKKNTLQQNGGSVMLQSKGSPLVSEKPSRWAGSDPAAIGLQVELGIFLGIATGLFGVGGAGLTLAALLLIFKLKTKVMLGTSLMASFFRYAGGSVGYLAYGQINIFFFVLLTVGGAIGSIVGARLVMKESVKDSYIQLIVVGLFFFIAYEFLK